ncbi:Hypothetical protein (Fragment) [Durusdinium trenchii]|uniref:Piezo non-specific cation channel R-Ras-binding domain-containing protein n=1 Tax=Durusdinium trenchii TaxID=1381693 RepID=A0ABP0IK14_9DINO
MAELPKLDFEDVPRTHPTPPSPSLGHARARKRPGKQVARRGSRIGKVGAGAGEEPPDEVRDRSSSVGRACTRLRTALQEYLMYHFWMLLTGLVAVGSAFTVQPWLSICDLVVGLLLLHSQIFQFAFQRCCSKWTEVDNALVLASLMLSILTLIVRIAQTSGKEVWFFDVIYLMTALVAVVCATCRGGAPNSAPDLRQVPASPVLWLCLLAATTAPPCVASLPYALMFLKLLDSLLTNSWQSLLPISYRWSLAILTSTHIVTLLVLNFMSWSQIAIPSGMLGVFGELGRTIVLFKDSITTCIHSSSMNCLSREESLWPGLHLASVMLLHFLLTNAGEGRSSEPTMAKSTSASSSTVMQSSDILTRILRTLGVLVLLSYCLAFPSLLTLPLLLLYVWKSFSSARLAEAEASRTGRSTTSSGCCTSSSGCCATTAGCCSRCRCCSRRYREDDVKGSESSLYESSGCGVAHGWARYIALVFVFFYVYNVLEELLDHLWPEAAETLTSLRLRVLTGITGIDLVRALGLTVYRLSEPHAAFAAFTPQALMLLALAGIQALLEGGFSAEMSPWLSSIDKNGRNLWVYISRQTPAELPMLVALVGILMTTSAAFGETPVLLVAYALVWAKVVCGKLEVGQPRTWCWLQSLAQLGLVVMSLLYLVAPALTGRSSEAVQTLYKAFPELKREHYLKIVLPHLVLGCCAYLERLRIAQVTILTVQGRLRVDTLESIETASSWGVESTISRSSTQSRCLRALIRYKNLMVAKLRKWTDELICIFVLVLSFAAALVPGTDIHSLALLLGTGPALLLYNTRGTYRARKLDCGYFVLRFSTALMFVFRLTAASRLIDWPDDTQWPISLKELGVIRPLWDPPMKLAMLGMIAVFSRVAIIATMRREEDDRRTEEVDQVAEEPPMSKPAERVEEEKPATSGVEEKPAEESQSSTFTSEIEAEIPDEHSGNTQEIPKEETTVSIYPSPRIQRPSVRFAPSTVEAVHRDKLHRLRVHRPGMEERILTWLIPSWMEFMPLNMHVYLSALLLVLVFALSIQEVNILSFLMMLAVICLCGWSNRWVQAGNVFSCTTLAVMWLQYLARFRYLENLATSDGTSDVWLRRVGLEWTSSQVEKHCAILFVCILQKQYWYRGRFSKARPVVCPSFVADHADMAGFFGLISVAVIRRHALSTLLVLGALPWVVREELPFKESAQRHAHTKWWLRWFRLVLFFILVIEVSLRLLLTFNLGEEVGRDQLVNWICNEYWKGASHPRAFDSCLVEFTHWIDSANAQQGSTPLMLMEFLCLFFLGMVQQLLECTSSQTLEAETLQRKKLTVLYWWPLLVWCCAFTLSLARGTLLGLCFLVLLLGVTFSNSSSLPTRRRWVWRTRLFALLFLLIGLAFQSPLLPCSRAACQDGIHQIYVTQDECVKMEAFDLSLVGSEAQSAHCGAPDHGASLGHDTSWTLFVQILGVRRVSGASLWEGIAALFLSQLGQLVLLIAATTVQLRMYSSRLFAKYLDVFVEESEDVIFARAQRFATEFYCGAKLQELASRNRVKAQLDALDALDACGTFWKASWVVDGVDQLVDGEGTPNDAP